MPYQNKDRYLPLDSFDLYPCFAALLHKRVSFRNQAIIDIHRIAVHGKHLDLIRQKAVQPLVKALTDTKLGSRREAAIILGIVRAEEAIVPLVKIGLSADKRPLIGRVAVYFSLGLIGGHLATMCLDSLMETCGFKNMGRILDAVKMYELPEIYSTYPNAFLNLGFANDQMLNDLLIKLRKHHQDTHKDPDEFPYVASKERLDVYLQNLQHHDDVIRYLIVGAISGFINNEGAYALIDVLRNDPSLKVQMSAAVGLRNRHSIKTRLQILLNHQSAEVRQKATDILAKVAKVKGVEEALNWFDNLQKVAHGS